MEFEKLLGEHSEDVRQVKSVLTVLGYLTKSSLATIKTKSNVLQLEKDYMKIRQNSTKFGTACVKYPELIEVDSFTPGLMANIMNIAAHIKKTEHGSEVEDEQTALSKVLALGQKVLKNNFHFFVSLNNWLPYSKLDLREFDGGTCHN